MFTKPLFSRRQLNIIIFVTALAIVLLSASGRREDLPVIERHQLGEVSLYALADDSDGQRLRLSFALPAQYPGDGLAVQVLKQLLLEPLGHLPQRPEWRQWQARLGAAIQPDRLQIDLALAADADPGPLLDALLQRLQQPIDAASWRQAQQQQQARRYLDSQSQSSAESLMRAWLAPRAPAAELRFAPWQAFRQQLLSRSQLTLSLMGADVEEHLVSLRRSLQALPLGTRWPTEPTPSAARQPSLAEPSATREPAPSQSQSLAGPGAYRLLLGRHTAGRRNDQFANELLAIQVIQNSARTLNIDSHWTPLAEQGLLRLTASGAAPIVAEQLLQQLRQQASASGDEGLDSSRQTLIDRVYQQRQDPSLQFDQLETIAFYRLPVDYLERFVNQLEQLSLPALRDRILTLLDPRQFYRILEGPAG